VVPLTRFGGIVGVNFLLTIEPTFSVDDVNEEGLLSIIGVNFL
jgi:hypothetical protein